MPSIGPWGVEGGQACKAAWMPPPPLGWLAGCLACMWAESPTRELTERQARECTEITTRDAEPNLSKCCPAVLHKCVQKARPEMQMWAESQTRDAEPKGYLIKYSNVAFEVFASKCDPIHYAPCHTQCIFELTKLWSFPCKGTLETHMPSNTHQRTSCMLTCTNTQQTHSHVHNPIATSHTDTKQLTATPAITHRPCTLVGRSEPTPNNITTALPCTHQHSHSSHQELNTPAFSTDQQPRNNACCPPDMQAFI